MSAKTFYRSASIRDIFMTDERQNNLPVMDRPLNIIITGSRGMVGNGLAKAIEFMRKRDGIREGITYLASREWSIDQIKGTSGYFKCVTYSEMVSIREKIDLVIHTASPSNITKVGRFDDLYYSNVNLLQKLQLLQPKVIVYLSSGEVYGGENLSEGAHSMKFSMMKRRDWYPIAKLEGERVLRKYTESTGATGKVIRLFHTFGPGLNRKDGRSFGDFIWDATVKNEIYLQSDGNQVRSFLYLADAIEAILKVGLVEEPNFQILNVGSPFPISIKDFAKVVSQATNSPIQFISNSSFEHSTNNYLIPNINLIRNYDWEVRTDLVEGVKRTLKWAKSQIRM